VLADDPINVVLAPPFVSNIEHFWQQPESSLSWKRLVDDANDPLFHGRVLRIYWGI